MPNTSAITSPQATRIVEWYQALPFPDIDPVLISFGPFAVRWYSLAYIAGLVLGWRLIRHHAVKPAFNISPNKVNDFLIWATLGIILGGRIGYVLFYNFAYFAENPGKIFILWEGCMSFHGGLLGVVIATFFSCRQHKINFFNLSDLLACATPIGLFFGRIANFINAELFGRVTDVPWGIVFPNGGPAPRHPSQLYEAVLEGLLLFFALNFIARHAAIQNRSGFLTGAFLSGYAASRIFVELFRQPDPHIGFLLFNLTMGQLLSLPMLAAGIYIMFRSQPAK